MHHQPCPQTPNRTHPAQHSQARRGEKKAPQWPSCRHRQAWWSRGRTGAAESCRRPLPRLASGPPLLPSRADRAKPDRPGRPFAALPHQPAPLLRPGQRAPTGESGTSQPLQPPCCPPKHCRRPPELPEPPASAAPVLHPKPAATNAVVSGDDNCTAAVRRPQGSHRTA